MGTSRPNPSGGWGLRAISLSLVVADVPASPPPLFATSPRNPIRKRHRIYEREYLAQGAVPILLLTGEKDTTILPEQSESLHHRAQSLGLDSTFVLVSNSGHGWRPLGGPIVPSQEEIHTLTAEFIRKHTSRRTD